MQNVKVPPYVRSRNPAVATWQSAVEEVVRERIENENPEAGPGEIGRLVHQHPMLLGTNFHVAELNGEGRSLTPEAVRPYFPSRRRKLRFSPVVHAYLSQEHLAQALAEAAGDGSASAVPPVEFPDSDYAYAQWAKCAAIWAAEGNPDPSPYVNVDGHRGPTSPFGLISIPEDSSLLVLGDFGTGLNDATTLLIAALEQLHPDFIVHLGDIYYSGTEDQCKAYVRVFDRAFSAAGKKVPVFSIPGNHEYYAGGWGFFKHVIGPSGMNRRNGFVQYQQMASFFGLRTEKDSWQLLGMDTGYNSVHNFNIAHPTQLNASYAPWLEFSEAAWHQHKLATFDGRSILLSHHQLFSAHSVINDGKGVCFQTGTDKKKLAYLNGNLEYVFRPYLPKVAAWFWGHEHSLDIFEKDQAGLQKGRLIGNSGYEEWQGEDPYKPSSSPYREVSPAVELGVSSVRWGASFNFLNHGFAMIRLEGTHASVDYYQYPVFAPGKAIPSRVPPIRSVKFKDQLP